MPRTCRRLPAGLSVAASLLLLTGCGTGPDKPFVPPMPTVRVAPPPPAADRAAALATAQAALDRDDLGAAIAAVQGLPDADRAAAYLDLATAEAGRDPQRLARFARAMPAGEAQERSLAIAVQAMAVANRDAAARWAFALQPPRLRYVAVETLAAGAVASDPRAAMQWIQSLPETSDRDELLRLAAADWARRDPGPALAWAETLSGSAHDEVTASIGFELAQSDPPRAVTVANSLPKTRDRWLLVSEIAQTWIAHDPKAADAWVRTLNAGPEKDAALAGFEAATAPVGSAPGARVAGVPARAHIGGAASALVDADALRSEFERELQQSPATAAQWLSTLPSPDVTDDMLRRLAYEWFRQDPISARAWFLVNVPSSPLRHEILESAAP